MQLVQARRLAAFASGLGPGLAGAALLGLLVVLAVAAPGFAPHDPYAGEIIDRLRPPWWEPAGGTQYLLGTDGLGRDVLSRLIYAARVSLVVAAVASLVSAAVGVPLGLAAGYVAGSVDRAISIAVDIMLTFPFILLALAAIAVLGSGLVNLIVVLGLAGWPTYTRLVRADTRRLKQTEFVVAAHSLGVPDWRIVLRHILPNLLGAVVVLGSAQAGRVIIAEAFLSFLGLGVKPPTPTWGNMLGEARNFMYDRWWLPTFPGIMIFITTLAVSLLGDGLRDLLDPRQHENR